MERDIVCGMQVDDDTTLHTAEYDGRTFYFCSAACKAKFDQRPEIYASRGRRIREHTSAVFTRPDPKPR